MNLCVCLHCSYIFPTHEMLKNSSGRTAVHAFRCFAVQTRGTILFRLATIRPQHRACYWVAVPPSLLHSYWYEGQQASPALQVAGHSCIAELNPAPCNASLDYSKTMLQASHCLLPVAYQKMVNVL